MSRRLKELLQTCFCSYLILLLFRIVVWGVVFNEFTCLREDKKALNLGLIVRLQTIYIYNALTNVWILLLSVLLVRYNYLDSFVLKQLQRKINSQNANSSNALHHYMGRDKLTHARWKSRRLLAVVSLSFGVGENNCSQDTVSNAFSKRMPQQHLQPFVSPVLNSLDHQSWQIDLKEKILLQGFETWLRSHPAGVSMFSLGVSTFVGKKI